jgi:hypothetical protein
MEGDDMSDASKSITLLGGPSSGKSTYLGALIDALQMEKLRHLGLESLADDSRALQRLADPLLEARYPARTMASGLDLEVRLRTIDTYFDRLPFSLQASDYDGEQVEQLFRDRVRGWSKEWQQRAQGDGIMLLIRPAAEVQLPRPQLPPDVSEAELWQRLRRTNVKAPVAPRAVPPRSAFRPERFLDPIELEETPPAPRLSPADPVRVPTVLALIELLQFIRYVRGLTPGKRPSGKDRFRIALVVSAWDSVAQSWRASGPAAYLAQHMPLLEDFLWSNFLPDDIYRFGLSATGGDLHDAAYAARYQDNPGGFVEWRGMDRVHRRDDLGLPLYWLLFGDRALGVP